MVVFFGLLIAGNYVCCCAYLKCHCVRSDSILGPVVVSKLNNLFMCAVFGYIVNRGDLKGNIVRVSGFPGANGISVDVQLPGLSAQTCDLLQQAPSFDFGAVQDAAVL